MELAGQIVIAIISGASLIMSTRGDRNSRRAAENTSVNGHGVVVKDAVGIVIDGQARIEAKVDNLERWAAGHQVKHDFDEAVRKAEAIAKERH